MQIIVNDTNLFIDLIHAELIDLFFRLPFEVHTTDFVVGEIEGPDQESIIRELIVTERLYVAGMAFSEVEEINLNCISHLNFFLPYLLRNRIAIPKIS